MAWHPDVPNIPIKKPKEIETLELMDRVSLDSMPSLEVEEKVDEIAHAVARDYKRQVKHPSYDKCLDIVSIALQVTGCSIGGHVGHAMVAARDSAALRAARNAFPVDNNEM